MLAFILVVAIWRELALGAAPTVADRPSLVRVERKKPCMGTTLRLVAYGPDEPSVLVALDRAFARAEALNGILSDYQADSELMRLVARAGKSEAIAVGPELWEVLGAAQVMAQRTGGAFDVTVGPYTREWRLARKGFRLPDPEVLDQARQVVGYHKMELLPGQKVLLRKAGMRLDLGGIAKGYTGDQLLLLLRQAGFPRALVALGGDVVAGDAPPGQAGWTVELIDLPGDKGGKRTLTLHNQAVSTSGDLEQFLEVEGKRYSHLVDPRTGMGTTDRAAATVIASKGIDADSLTNACCLLPEVQALAVVATYTAQARLVRPAEAGNRIITTPHFPGLR